MKTVTVNASKSYNVLIGSGLLPQVGNLIADCTKVGKAVIVSDTNVWPLHGDTVAQSLLDSGYCVFTFVFTAGEASKNSTTYLSLLSFLAEKQITRSDLIVALGGGVVGDLTGFAAATFLRGIPYVQIPTSLLAMVDSSVGGKTAIDLPVGKNLVGAFYQPNLVVCDIDALGTLPQDVFIDGCAEVIKYGILFDSGLFSHLETMGLKFDRESVIARCVELKRDVVMEDEFDKGLRQKLNLGHTIGHAVEAQSNYTLSHGKAVAIGTAIVSRTACSQSICNRKTTDRIEAILKQFALPTTTKFTAAELILSALSDKKRSGGNVNLIVPAEIGNCLILPTAVEKLQEFIETGL